MPRPSMCPAEPRVRILRPQERVLELRVLVLERVELACELSVADAPVRWFKDGLEVDETDDLLLMAEGTRRCLVLPRAGTEDAGEYICETRDESVSFDVRVSGKHMAGACTEKGGAARVSGCRVFAGHLARAPCTGYGQAPQLSHDGVQRLACHLAAVGGTK